jgi:hypothetical protein
MGYAKRKPDAIRAARAAVTNGMALQGVTAAGCIGDASSVCSHTQSA